MTEGYADDKETVGLIRRILFFGVPNQGMDIEALVPMVGDRPNRQLLESLGEGSDLLNRIATQFLGAFPLTSSEIVSFYETKKSPTAQKVGHHFSIIDKYTKSLP